MRGGNFFWLSAERPITTTGNTPWNTIPCWYHGLAGLDAWPIPWSRLASGRNRHSRHCQRTDSTDFRFFFLVRRWCSAVACYAPSLRHRPRRFGFARLAQEAEGAGSLN